MVLDLVYIYKDGCGPCDAMAPIVEEFQASRPEINIYKFPFLSEEEIVIALKKEFDLKSIPFFIAYADGEVVSSKLGYSSASELAALFDH
jgi:thiol-disulfide isomerase/thioredoxin